MKEGMLNKWFVVLAGMVLLSAFSFRAHAQQDPMYTQYMDNLLVINPGYAGSHETGNLLMVARSQWVDIKGAPSTRSFAYNTPYDNKNLGVGFSLMSDRIGPLKQTGFYVDYSYFIRVSKDYKLGMGLKGGVSFYRANLTDLVTIESDPLFDNDLYANFLPNVGVGFYLFSDDTYLGLSVPRLVENKITRDEVQTSFVYTQKMHFYLVGGHTFKLNNPDFSIKANGLVKYVYGAPISFDVNAQFGIREQLWLGAMYRYKASYGFMAQFKPSDKLRVGYSYDILFSDLRAFQKGTHEIMLSYDIDLFNRNYRPAKEQVALH